MKVSRAHGWNETSAGKLKYLRKNLPQNPLCPQKIPMWIGLDLKLGCRSDNLGYGMTFEYSTTVFLNLCETAAR